MDDKKRGGSTLKEAFYKWSGLLIVILAALLFYFVISNFDQIGSVIKDYISILRPVVYGCVIAYILNPLMKTYNEFFLWLLEKKGAVSEKKKSMLTGLSITLALLSGIFIIVVLCWMIIPQLIISATSLINTMPDKVNDLYQYIYDKIQNNKFLAEQTQKFALNLTDYLDKVVNDELLPWLRSDFLSSVNQVATQFANGLMSVLSTLYNLFIGIIVAIYLLGSKSTFLAQAKKMIYGIFRKKTADAVIHYVRLTNDMFSGFIVGKIVDSTIVGIICFVCMSIMKLPYAMLISVIIGVTNIIPVFGPYLGLIPSALLILIVNPIQALYFVILIAILQQVDGNLLGPAILGESTGLSAFWVLFSILLFGGMWGIIGMIIGVPLFAVIYRIIADFINWKLQKKELSCVTDQYRNLRTIREEEGKKAEYITYTKEELMAKKAAKKQHWDERKEKQKEKMLYYKEKICSSEQNKKK